MKTFYENQYRHCSVVWQTHADSMCNDRCPDCNKEIEPFHSEPWDRVNIKPNDRYSIFSKHTLLTRTGNWEMVKKFSDRWRAIQYDIKQQGFWEDDNYRVGII